MSGVTKYDYSAVDAYFDRLNEVHRHRANRFRMENIRSILPNTALLVASIGLACLLAFIGYSLIVNPKPTKVVEILKPDAEIIERMTENVITGENPPGEPGTIVKNYVLFTFISVDSVVGVSVVITGKQYKIEGVKKITNQSEFLKKIGILERANILSKKMTFKAKANMFYRLKRLLDYKEMGSLFKVLFAQKKGRKFSLGF